MYEFAAGAEFLARFFFQKVFSGHRPRTIPKSDLGGYNKRKNAIEQLVGVELMFVSNFN